ncbi:MAG: BolA family transcriptional regulator [Legionella sp.]|nr:BolA family transcriptional regulator [Legionella sp.]
MSRKNRIELLLNQELTPVYLNVEDESANHHVPKDAETHFKVTAVSPRFIELTRIARHRLLNQLLSNEFELGLHALSMHLYTPEEWEKNGTVLKSPSCKDGYKNG